MNGTDAIALAREVSKIPDGYFNIAYFPYSRTRQEASDKLKVSEHCKFRAQLPTEQFSTDSENFFLFEDKNGDPKMCYRILIRFMGFPTDEFKLKKIDWL